MTKPTVSTLFAGCGGDTLGFVNAGFELVFTGDTYGWKLTELA